MARLSLFVALFATVAIISAVSAYTPCSSSSYKDSYSSLPAGPTFPSATLASTKVPTGRVIVQNHYSEVASLASFRPAKFTPSSNPSQTNCPHTQTGLKNWHDPSIWTGGVVPANGSNVNIPANSKVLISSCSFDPTFVFGTITVPVNSSLIIGDAPISIQAKGFSVAGAFQVGSPTCRLRNKISITLHGSRGAQALPAASSVKGIAVTGSVDIHGAQYFPTWSRLAMGALINDTIIFIQDLVNWQVGQSVFITTTEIKDARDWHRNEVAVIKTVYKATSVGANVTAIELTVPLKYNHWAGTEYQAEVGLLTRNILIQGDAFNSNPTDVNSPVCNDTSGGTHSTFPCENQYLTGFGGHVQVIGASASGRFSGIELNRMGQTNVLGRYPLHFHLVGQTTNDKNYATDNSVHDSFFRCYTIHGTHGVLLSQNTAYNAIGNCFYLSEDGVEENNTVQYNLAAFVHPIGPVQGPSLGSSGDGFYGQYLGWFTNNTNLLIPADMSAAGFYITNMYSTFEGNAASGGWAGFSFPSLPAPIGDFRNNVTMSPQGRPFRTPFQGNSAHSSGFWWGSASAFYMGGVLEYTDASKTTLHYTAGRSVSQVHDTCSDKTAGTPAGPTGCYDLGSKLWLEFTNNKAFLSNRGLQAWGNRANIVRFEIHDTALSMNVFGQIWIDKMLMNCRSNNTPTWYAGCPVAPPVSQTPRWGDCNVRDFYYFSSIGGFQWYDVGQNHILTDSTFRNCRNDWAKCIYGSAPGVCGGAAVFTSLSHSDQFVPQLMQITNKVRYQNTNNVWRFSTKLTGATNNTVSGRMQNWIDADGSASGNTQRSMIGSTWAGGWWNMNSLCTTLLERVVCPMAAKDGAAAMKFHHNPTLEANIGGSVCRNGQNGSFPCPTVGVITHFGHPESDGVGVAVNPQVSGPVMYKSGGWFLRFSSGTPNPLNISEIQLSDVNLSLVIAIPYPAGTTFNISFVAASWCSTSWGVCTHYFRSVSSVSAVISGFGDVYYWDNSARLLYIKPTMQNSYFGNKGTDAPWTSLPPVAGNFTRGGQTINPIAYDPKIVINAYGACTSNPCAAQASAKVPSLLNPSYVDNVPASSGQAPPPSGSGSGNEAADGSADKSAASASSSSFLLSLF